jgi:outer membrane lipoprotein-sorting protein
MRASWGWAAVLLLGFGGAQAQTVDELVAKNVEARGGLAAIEALKSTRASGKMQFSGGDFSLELGYAGTVLGGSGCRTEVSLQGLTAITAYDGKEGWNISPFQGRRDPERMSADDAKSLEYCADLAGPLVDFKAKGHQVEYLGTEDVDGTEAHKLKVTLANGNVQFTYLDPDYFLEIRTLSQTTVRGVKQEQETDVGNYEQVAGVWMPFSIESGPKGGPKGQKITLDKVEANVDVDPAQFAFPAK